LAQVLNHQGDKAPTDLRRGAGLRTPAFQPSRHRRAAFAGGRHVAAVLHPLGTGQSWLKTPRKQLLTNQFPTHRNTPGLTLKPVYPPGPFWLYFPEQWDAASPWHDERVRRAANLAIDRNTINEALTLGFSKLTNSIIPDMFDAWDGSFAGTESSISLPPPQFNLYSRGHVHRAAIRRSSAAGCRRQTMEAPR
jgi:Bacterial extracellular solute-binding proteins, family 5 Middle